MKREYVLRAGMLLAAACLLGAACPGVLAQEASPPEMPPAVTEPAPAAPPATAPPAAAEPAASPPAAQPAPAPAPAPYTGPRLNLLILPFDSQVEQEANTLGPRVARALKDVSHLSSQYSGMIYNPRHPVIRRALEENVLKESDVRGIFGIEEDQVLRALRIAQVMEIPRVMVGAISDFQFDSEKREGQITLTAEILNAETGRVEGQTLVATGRSPANMVAGLPEQFALAATENAVSQLAARFPGIARPTPVAENGVTVENGQPEPGAEPRKKRNNTGLLAALAVLAGILIAGGGGGDGGAGVGIDGPPPPPF